MVECELYLFHVAAKNSPSFNRYMVECELQKLNEAKRKGEPF